MRILEIAPPWFSIPPSGYGGIEWIVALLADGLVEAGHEVTLLASGGSITLARLESVFEAPPSKQIGNIWYETRHVATGYLRRHEFELIHDHTGTVGPTLGALLEGPPVVHTLHGPWTPEVGALHALLAPRLQLVAISHDQARRAPRGVHLAAVVPNGIPLESFSLRRERRGTAGYLAFVGRANREKGPEVAVQVARRLRRPLKMLVKINEPPEEAYWHDNVAPHLVGADVELVPDLPMAEKARLLAGAEATLFPARWPEPFGLAMVESMACGTPVVGYADGAVPEVVADGETGFIVPPDDLDALCEAVGRVAEIDPLACRARVEQRYSGQAMVAGYVSLFERLTSTVPRAPMAPGPAHVSERVGHAQPEDNDATVADRAS
jgi:glycosyltransferase involved in cell wall biosynthesis